MKKEIRALRERVLEAGEVPEPEVATVELQVRTDAAVPPPRWLRRAIEDRDAKPPTG